MRTLLLSLCLVSALATLVVAGCQGTPPNTTEEWVKARAGLCPERGGASASYEHYRKFKVNPGMQDPDSDGGAPAGYELYGCYPLDPNQPGSIEVCLYIDPQNPGKVWLVRPAGSLDPFWKIAPDRRAPAPNFPGWTGQDLSKHDGMQIGCISWETYTLSAAGGDFDLETYEIGQADQSVVGATVRFTPPMDLPMGELEEFGVTLLVDGVPPVLGNEGILPAGQEVMVAGSVEAVAAFLANHGFDTLNMKANGRPVTIQTGGLWPFALATINVGKSQREIWVVLDADATWGY